MGKAFSQLYYKLFSRKQVMQRSLQNTSKDNIEEKNQYKSFRFWFMLADNEQFCFLPSLVFSRKHKTKSVNPRLNEATFLYLNSQSETRYHPEFIAVQEAGNTEEDSCGGLLIQIKDSYHPSHVQIRKDSCNSPLNENMPARRAASHWFLNIVHKFRKQKQLPIVTKTPNGKAQNLLNTSTTVLFLYH